MPKLYTVKEVSKIFKRTPRTIYRWIDGGFISVTKVKDGYLIPHSEVNRIISIGRINITQIR